MMYCLRSEWEMDFAEGGRQALGAPGCRALRRRHQRISAMPGMDGSELLRQTMLRYPDTMHIVLSGQCDRRTVINSIEPTHQFLSKPCQPEILRETLIRAGRRRAQLDDPWYRRMVSQVTSVPTLPAAHEQLAAELRSPGTSLPQVYRIIARDVGMTAKIMQLISSSFFGTPQKVTDPLQAARLFNLETIQDLLHATSAFDPLTVRGHASAYVERLLDHSLAVAKGARLISQAEKAEWGVAEQAFLAGFLHDLGILIKTEHATEIIAEVMQASLREGVSLDQAEKSHTGVTHGDIGGYLLALWGLPDPIVQAVTYHHCPGAAGNDRFTPLTAVHVATALDSQRFAGIVGATEPIDRDYLQSLGLWDHLDGWRELCAAAWRQTRGAPPTAASC